MSAHADPSFEPDRDGLRAALDLLIAELSAPSGGTLDLGPDLPELGAGDLAALERLAPSVLGSARRLGDPGFLAHMDPPVPWVAWAGAQWAAATGQNLLHPETAPVARELERVVVGWLAPFFGMDGGHLVPGSSVANLTALWAARELRGVEEVVASDAAHLSVRKAAALLSLPLRAVEADRVGRLDAGALGDLSRSALVLTAGTTVTGAVDPLGAGQEAAWRHVDAAWAGPLRLSSLHAGLLDGLESADSVAVSAHKWLFQPKESALVLFADTAAAHEAVSFGGGYLAAPNVGVLGSHGAAALPLAATLLAWGREGTAARIDGCMEIATRLVELVQAADSLELYSGPETGVVVWRPREPGGELEHLRDRMERGFVSVTSAGGERWLRSVSANPMAEPELVVAAVLAATRG